MTKSTRADRVRARFVATLVAVVGVALLGGPTSPASAGPADSSSAAARFLSGNLLGLSLDSIVSLGGAAATNTGSPTPVVTPAALSLSALSALTVTVPSGVTVPLTDVVRIGAANQYASASDSGVSRAGSGAISDAGAVTVGGSAAFPAKATFDLAELLGPQFAGQIADLDLAVNAITGVAAVDAAQGTTTLATDCADLSAPVHCRDYSIAGATLTINSPAVAGVATLLTGTGGVTSKVDAAVAALAGPNGLLAGVLATVSGITALLGNPGITATITTNTTAALNTILTTPIASPSGAVSINLSTGVITVNLDTLLTDAGGNGLASLGPNTPLLSSAVLSTLVSEVTGVLNTVPTLVANTLTTTLNAATVNISANICLVGLPCPGSPVTSIAVNVSGTVAQVVAGTATASIAVRLAGVNVPISVSTLLGALATPLTGTLLSLSTTAIPAVTTGVNGILGTLSPVLSLINTVISLTGNVQESAGTNRYREVALRASLLGGGAGQVDLGRAEVGPNAVFITPTATGLSPLDGPATGGTAITVTGTGFVPGSTSVAFGGFAVPAAGVTVTDSEHLTFTTPPGVPGPVAVIVTTPGGTTAPPLGFAYQPVPLPVITTPVDGETVGTHTPAFGGTAAAPGIVAVFEGSTELCVATVVAGNWTCNAAGLPNGDHSVSVILTDTNFNNSPFTAAVTFTVAAPADITALDPASGPEAGGQEVTVTGTDFAADSVLTVDGTAVAAGDVTVIDANTLTFLTPLHVPGPVNVTVTAAGAASAPLTYTYLELPGVATIEPSAGPLAGGQTATITGSGFVPGETAVTVGGLVIPATDVTVTSATTLTFVTPAHALGTVDVAVTTNGGTSDLLSYEYLPLPTVDSLSPTTGPVAGGQLVTVTGTGFSAGTVISVDGAPVPAGDVVFGSATSLTFLTPAHPAGPAAVTATTVAGQSQPIGYTYLDPPTTLTVDPDSGPLAGGQTVTVTGTGFVDGATAVTIGGNTVPAAAVTVNSATSLTFTTPAHAAGTVSVVVGTAGGTSAALEYDYVAAPTAGALNPAAGPAAGGQAVTVTGTNFVTGGTTVTVDGATATIIEVSDPTTLTFLTPAHAVGSAEIVVSTPGGAATALPYQYLPLPSIGSLDPAVGTSAGGQTVTITGTGFDPSATVTVDGEAATGVLFVDTETLTYFSPDHAAGPVDVTVTALSGTTLPATYTYVDGPTAASIDVVRGPVAGGQILTVTGTGFIPGATSVTIGGQPVPAGSVIVASATSLAFSTPAHSAADVELLVTTPGGTSSALSYEYVAPPTTTAVNPAAGPLAGGQTVTVTGSGFETEGTVVSVGGSELDPAAVTVVSTTTLTFVAPANAAGEAQVVVSTIGGSSAPLVLTYYVAPVLDVLDTVRGPMSGYQIVKITGSGFVVDATTVSVDGAPPVAILVNDDQSVFFWTQPHAAGIVDVTVTTPGGTSNALSYEYLPLPTVTSVDPVSGPTSGGQQLVITGTGFDPGATIVTLDGVEYGPGGIDVLSATQVAGPTPPHAAGPISVSVRTIAGSSNATTYTYVAAPTVSAVDPVRGPSAGGQTVTVSGTDFVPGATTVTIGGTVVAAADVTVTGPTTLSFPSPAHDAGSVELTVSTPGGVSAPLLYSYVGPPTATALDPDSGPLAGQTVTLTGSGFEPGTTSVTVDGSVLDPADVTVLSPTQLVFTAPAHAAGPAVVTVTTTGGTSGGISFVYVAAPVATSLDPAAGPQAGGQTVTLTGTGFVPGATGLVFDGTVIPAGDVTVTSATTLIFVTPAGAEGPVAVTVTTVGGESSVLTYTYDALPTAVALTPETGPVTGGQTVTVTGTGFVAGQTSVSVDGTPVAEVTVASPTQLTFVSPAHAAAEVSVSVGTPSGSTAPLTYSYLPVPTAGALAPSAGPLVGGNTVTVTGTGFLAGFTTVTFDGALLAPAVAGDPTLSFVVPAGAVAGAVDVVVANGPDAVAAPLTYTFDAPTLTASSPTYPGSTSSLTGAGWPADTTVTVQLTTAASLPVRGASTTLTTTATGAFPAGVTLPVPVGTALGTDTAVAVDATENTATAEVVVQAAPPGTPTIEALDPAAGPLVGGTVVDVAGTGFVAGVSVVLFNGTEVPAAAISDTQLSFVVPPGTTAGPATVQVANSPTLVSVAAQYVYDRPTISAPGPVTAGESVPVSGSGWPTTAVVTLQLVDGSNTPIGPPVPVTTVGGLFLFTAVPVPSGTSQGLYTVIATDSINTASAEVGVLAGPPSASGITPDRGPVTGGQTVTIAGSGFLDEPVSVDVDGVPGTDVEVAADGLSLTFVTPSREDAGPVDVVVTTAGGSTNALMYTYDRQPGAEGITPESGPIAGGQTVTAFGGFFVPGFTTVTIGGVTIPATDVVVDVDGGFLTFVTPAHAVGPVDVTISTPGGTTDPQTYTYLPEPTTTGITPSSGAVAGGETVSISGTGFVPDATDVVVDGTPATGVTVASDGLSLSFTTAAHPAGLVQVVVTTAGGTSVAPLGFTYLDAPTATGVDPVEGPAAGGQTVTVTGTNFVAGATSVRIGGITVPTGSVAVAGATSLSFSTPAHLAGPVELTVTTAGGTSGATAYSYLPPPVTLTLSPTTGPLIGGTTLTVTGSGFTSGPTTATFEELPVPVTIVSDTELTLVSPAGTLAGTPVNVAVSINGGGSLVAGQFAYAVPVIDAASPVSPGTTSLVTGSGWPAADQVVIELLDGGVAVPGATVVVTTTVDGQLPAGTALPIPAGTALGDYSVSATDEDSNAATDDITVVAAAPDTPTLVSIDPATGTLAGGDTVTLTGTNFGGTTVVIFNGTTITPDTVTGDTLTFTVPTGTVSGPVNVQVSNGGEAVSGAVQYSYASPTVTVTGSTEAGGTVTVSGSGFRPRTHVRIALADIAGIEAGDPVDVETDDSGSFSAELAVPADSFGPHTVSVRDDNGNSAAQAVVVSSGPAIGLEYERESVGTGNFQTVSGNGFEPGLPISLILRSTPREIGPVIADANGSFVKEFDVSDLEVGSHTVTATQTRSDGRVSTLVQTFWILPMSDTTDTGTSTTTTTTTGATGGTGANGGGGSSGGTTGGELSYTGTDVGQLIPVALVLLMAGLLLILGTRRRFWRRGSHGQEL